MIFDFRLKVFYVVSQKLSFTKAGRELFISQPAVTKHIKELEEQLGTALFKRNGSSIALTPSGEVLLKHAREVFKIYASLENELAQLQDSASGHLRIGASTTLAQYVLPKILAMFKASYPSLHVSFVNGNSAYIEQQIMLEQLDIALVEGVSHHPQIMYEPFIKDELVLVVNGKNKLASKGEIKINQINSLPFVLREPGSGTLDVIAKSLEQIGLSLKDLKIEMHLGSTESIKQYLKYTENVAFLSIHSIANELKNKELSILDIKGFDIHRTFQFIHLHGHSSKLVDVFKRFCNTHYHL